MTLFEAGRQGLKVRGLLGVSLLAASGAAGLTLLSAAQLGASGDDLARGRLQLGLILLLVLGALAVGMALYARCYVTRVEIAGDGSLITMYTLGLLRDRQERVDPTWIDDTEYKDGDLGRVSAPWWTVRVRGRSLPFIIDAQGEFEDMPRFLGVLYGGSSSRRASMWESE